MELGTYVDGPLEFVDFDRLVAELVAQREIPFAG